MGSKFVIALTAAAAAVFIFIDLFAHGHFSPEYTKRRVTDRVETAGIDTLKDFNVDVEDRSAILKGNVDTAEERR